MAGTAGAGPLVTTALPPKSDTHVLIDYTPSPLDSHRVVGHTLRDRPSPNRGWGKGRGALRATGVTWDRCLSTSETVFGAHRFVSPLLLSGSETIGLVSFFELSYEVRRRFFLINRPFSSGRQEVSK